MIASDSSNKKDKICQALIPKRLYKNKPEKTPIIENLDLLFKSPMRKLNISDF